MATGFRAELSQLFGRAQIVVRGAEELRLKAEQALAEGRYGEGLRLSRELLLRVPDSPVGLALLADAAEAAGELDDAYSALLALLAKVPWEPRLQLRLGWLQLALGMTKEGRASLVQVVAGLSPEPSLTEAACELADLDLRQGDAPRALAWLERAKPSDERVLERRAAGLLALGRLKEAEKAMQPLGEPGALNGRRALLAGRLALGLGKPAREALVRAYVLDEPGAFEALTELVALANEADRSAIEDVVAAKGDGGAPSFQAALAVGRGDRNGGRRAWIEALHSGHPQAPSALVQMAIEDRDSESLRHGLSALSEAGKQAPAHARALDSACRLLAQGERLQALGALDLVGDHPWAHELRASVYGELLQRADSERGKGHWLQLAEDWAEAARRVGDPELFLAIEEFLAETLKPLRVAIMGEFNAGKSTFLNALLGASYAPMGILPTTASLHYVAYSPDAYARIQRQGLADRVIGPSALREALKEEHAAGSQIQQVNLGLPEGFLRRVEFIDTPGFNAPNAEHAQITRAGFAHADAVLWLVDAAQALSHSELEVVQELVESGLPIEVLVNKRDRLSPEQAKQVHEHLGQALAGNLPTRKRHGQDPPWALISAKLALQARLEEQPAAGGWEVVEELLQALGGGRGRGYKQRALCRRGAQLTSRLADRLASLAEAEEKQRARKANERLMAYQAAAALDAHPEGLQEFLVTRVGHGPLGKLREDLQPLMMASAQRSVKERYALQRVHLRLVRPLCVGAKTYVSRHHQVKLPLPQLELALESAFAGVVAGSPGLQALSLLPDQAWAEAAQRAVSAILRGFGEDTAGSQSHGAGARVWRLGALQTALLRASNEHSPAG